MKINFTYIFLVMFMIFVINRNMNKNFIYEKNENMIVSEEKGDTQKTPTESIVENIKTTLVKLNEASPIKIKALSDNKEPVRVIKNNYEEVLDTSKFNEKKDFISPNPEDTTEYRFIDENMKTAWSNINVSQHPKYYTSDVQDEKINIGGFFNKEKLYNDNTSPNSITTLPERCRVGVDNEVLCDFNDKLQLIPPKLIEDSDNNGVLNSIGNNIFKSVESTNYDNINDNHYQVWEYKDEKSINGGSFFNGVFGSSDKNENYMELSDIKSNYSF